MERKPRRTGSADPYAVVHTPIAGDIRVYRCPVCGVTIRRHVRPGMAAPDFIPCGLGMRGRECEGLAEREV